MLSLLFTHCGHIRWAIFLSIKIVGSCKTHLKLPHPPLKQFRLSFAILATRQVITKFIKSDGRPSKIVRLFTNWLNC